MRTCAQKGCPTLVVRGRCAAHAREVDRAEVVKVAKMPAEAWETEIIRVLLRRCKVQPAQVNAAVVEVIEIARTERDRHGAERYAAGREAGYTAGYRSVHGRADR